MFLLLILSTNFKLDPLYSSA